MPTFSDRLARFRRRLIEALRNPSGALDLASIMVGVLVIGAFAGIVAATVFAVIPWAQDQAAKGALDSVRTAESVRYAGGDLSTGAETGTYTGFDDLVAAELIAEAPNVQAVASSDGSCYVAAVRSQSDRIFYTSSASPDVFEYASGASSSCDALDQAVSDPKVSRSLPTEPAGFRQVSSLGSQNVTSVTSSTDGKRLTMSSFVDGISSLTTSADSGKTWQAQAGAVGVSVGAASADGRRLVGSANQRIATSSDYGVTWTTDNNSAPAFYRAFASSADGQRLVAGSLYFGNSIRTSSDYGATWTERVVPGVRNVAAVSSSTDGKYLTAGGSSAVATSSDFGVTWTKQGFTTTFLSIAGSADGRNLIAGAEGGGGLWRSTNFGGTWNRLSLGAGSWSGLVSSADGQRLVASSNQGSIAVSGDGGGSWRTSAQASEYLSSSATPPNWGRLAGSADAAKVIVGSDMGYGTLVGVVAF